MGYVPAEFGVAIAAAYLIAHAAWPLLARGGVGNRLGIVIAGIAIGACPLLIPAHHVVDRAFACLLFLDPIFRLVDYARQVRQGKAGPLTWKQRAIFLIPFPFLLTVLGAKRRARVEARLPAANVIRFLVAFTLGVGATLLCMLSTRVDILRESFVLDHLVKMILFLVVVESGSQALLVVERAFGYRSPPIVNQAWRARTPAEFWIRFNQRVQQWLYLDVFVPAGGRRRRVAGVVAVFLVSAMFHEAFFAIATSRLDGYQFAFFVLQAPAVLASPLLDRLAARGTSGRIGAHVLTWLWFAVTSPLFFRAADRVFYFFYASEPWLP